MVITAHYNFMNIKALSEVIWLGRYNGFNLTTLASSNLHSNGSTYHDCSFVDSQLCEVFVKMKHCLLT
ncbi:hypothetical protein Pcinc_014863 [Petrolisthes cinctipes]|uniref:Uncharacterized protein n=1 Tax=Petrolisthes cinctipes TaxID=88211 RepID=A0AAE1FU73_PETCI|nr:hypothetical protein Pcinc_014863 [Petrolisthes cinctipes]